MRAKNEEQFMLSLIVLAKKTLFNADSSKLLRKRKLNEKESAKKITIVAQSVPPYFQFCIFAQFMTDLSVGYRNQERKLGVAGHFLEIIIQH